MDHLQLMKILWHIIFLATLIDSMSILMDSNLSTKYPKLLKSLLIVLIISGFILSIYLDFFSHIQTS